MRGSVIDTLGILLVWCISLLIVKPLGDFPLSDDWAYALTVKHMVKSLDFQPVGWIGMPFVTNALWGSVFCIPFGFSFPALRISTITASLIGILSLYILVRRELSQSRLLTIIIVPSLGFNPIYYALSNTFMTDVPFTAVVIVAVLFFGRNLKSDSNFDLVIGTILLMIATLSRQLAISIGISFAVCVLLARGFGTVNIVRGAIPVLASIAAFLAFQKWLELSGRLPAGYFTRTDDLLGASSPRMLLLSLATNTRAALIYLGSSCFRS